MREIWRYYARIASPDIADNLLRDINRAAERARTNPLAWRTRDELRPGLRSVIAHPYTVFYIIEANAVQAVRVLHERRDFSAALSKDDR